MVQRMLVLHQVFREGNHHIARITNNGNNLYLLLLQETGKCGGVCAMAIENMKGRDASQHLAK